MLPGSGTAPGKPAPTIVNAEAQLSTGCHGCLRDPPVVGPLWGSCRSHASMPQSVLLRMSLRVAHRTAWVISTRCYCAQSICDHMHTCLRVYELQIPCGPCVAIGQLSASVPTPLPLSSTHPPTRASVRGVLGTASAHVVHCLVVQSR